MSLETHMCIAPVRVVVRFSKAFTGVHAIHATTSHTTRRRMSVDGEDKAFALEGHATGSPSG